MKSFLKNIFSTKKVIKNIFLNLFGLQILRILMYNFIECFYRKNFLDKNNPNLKVLKKEGIVVIKDFMSKKDFKIVNDLFNAIFFNKEKYQISDSFSGKLKLETIYLYKEKNKKFDQIFRLLIENSDLGKIIDSMDNRIRFLSLSTLKLQKISSIPKISSNEIDDQSFLHEDTFHNTYKVFYYPEEVGIKNNPFVYAKRTFNKNFFKLIFSYIFSIKYSLGSDIDGSRRISSFEKKLRSIKEDIFCVPQNTLVIVNTNGYHARYHSPVSEGRKMIGFNIRRNRIY
jgi:hypothetical protein